VAISIKTFTNFASEKQRQPNAQKKKALGKPQFKVKEKKAPLCEKGRFYIMQLRHLLYIYIVKKHRNEFRIVT